MRFKAYSDVSQKPTSALRFLYTLSLLAVLRSVSAGMIQNIETAAVASKNCWNRHWSVLLVAFSFCLLLLCFDYPTLRGDRGELFLVHYFRGVPLVDSCSGKYIYVHALPSKFNDDVLSDCKKLIKFFDMCPALANSGLGPEINNSMGVLQNKSWFGTNQFLLEVIFRERINRYKCLTNDSSVASAVFIPYYSGLEVGRHLWGFNVQVRDSLTNELVKWLGEKPEWKKMWGRDHFLIGGRIATDFRRRTNRNSDWGGNLMSLPESWNMTMLSIESSSWNNDVAIPYPTFFHPSSYAEVLEWQDLMRRKKRSYLFSFVGAPRPGSSSIRSNVIDQCKASNGSCQYFDCGYGLKCDDPVQVMKVLDDSTFCLEPPGDSPSRRSTFDSMLAGCIPVLFHPASAYTQYVWHLPRNFSKYSVYIPQDDIRSGRIIINETLSLIPTETVDAMREEVINLIPRITYADPRSRVNEFEVEDAFDIAIKGMLERIEQVRRMVSQGKDPAHLFSDWNSTKFDLPMA